MWFPIYFHHFPILKQYHVGHSPILSLVRDTQIKPLHRASTWENYKHQRAPSWSQWGSDKPPQRWLEAMKAMAHLVRWSSFKKIAIFPETVFLPKGKRLISHQQWLFKGFFQAAIIGWVTEPKRGEVFISVISSDIEMGSQHHLPRWYPITSP